MYLLLLIAALLFATQFIFNQKYQQTRGEGFDATLLFQTNMALVMVILMFILNKFQMQFTVFSTILGIVYAVDITLYIYFSMRAFSTANLSVYSIFAMLGGMILPFIYGTVFCSEGITIAKVVSCILIAVSLALTFEKGEKSTKNMVIYLAVFVFNGMMGVISKIHQSNTDVCVDSRSFIAVTYTALFIISLVWYLFRNRKLDFLSKKEFTYTSCYALCSGIAELFCLIALTVLPASVQYPMITGGTILFSTIISFMLMKKANKKEIISAVIALIATCVIIL